MKEKRIYNKIRNNKTMLIFFSFIRILYQTTNQYSAILLKLEKKFIWQYVLQFYIS